MKWKKNWRWCGIELNPKLIRHRLDGAEEKVEEVEEKQDEIIGQLTRIKWGIVVLIVSQGGGTWGPHVVKLIRTLIGA